VRQSIQQILETRRIDWPGVLRTLLVQVLVLVALSVAFLRYLDWSSEQAWAEFSRAVETAPATKAQLQSATPVRAFKTKAVCLRSI